ncbi:MAG: hypothetical protein E4H37_04860 [Gemmatimonadales bacterium]|nr:MAG: hypothetical protein E4H37_04860 [Gemmatimonadales bacterium]
MSAPGLLFVLGASAAGKTTAVQGLAACQLAGVRCHHFDSVGVPSATEMRRTHGSVENWQGVTTRRWVERLSEDPEGAEVYVLEGQTRPSFVLPALEAMGVRVAEIVLLDCTPEVRRARLMDSRLQPELATEQMDKWAAYLRGQADALGLQVIDTSDIDTTTAVNRLIAVVETLRARCAAA